MSFQNFIQHKLKLLRRYRFDRNSIWTWLLIGAIVSGGLALAWDLRGDTTEKSGHLLTPEPQDPESADTYIPAGYVLVPIEVANSEALDSILGQHGVVDLYIPAMTADGKPKKVATRIKIMRSPLNPSQFAVLSSEEDSPKLVSHEGAFFVVVQNRKQSGTEFVSGKPRKARSRITVEY